MFDDDHADRKGGRYRWLFSTCIAGLIGLFAIFIVIAGSTDRDVADGFMPALERLREDAMTPELIPKLKKTTGLQWAVPKTDKLEISDGLTSTRYVIHETLRQRRDGRSYIHAKPYMRIVARLAPVPASYQDVVPPFNPLQLYADNDPVGSSKGVKTENRSDVKITVVELIGGVLPREDGQRIDERESSDLIKRFLFEEAMAAAELADHNSSVASEMFSQEADETAFTTNLVKNKFEDESSANAASQKERVTVTVGRGDTLTALLLNQGVSQAEAGKMIAAARTAYAKTELERGQKIEFTSEPAAFDPGAMQLTSFALKSAQGEHLVSVSQDGRGGYSGSVTPLRDYAALRGLIEEKVSGPKSRTLYASVYHSALLQNVPPETVMQILRINAYQTDFGRRIRPGDTVELFFSFDNKEFAEGPPGELLYTKITAGGETAKFYRFRTTDGEVDFFDEQGNNSKRFLTRKPVRGSNVRLSSGYGMRYHPLLNRRRMHAGVDWAGPTGTPILAAGRGVIDFAGRKGQYGNFVKIRHANGYSTSYAHMRRFARGVKAGAKVRQGQIIGYIGSTGLSSGPHLHYEVHVNGRHVNPMTIKVPRERQLKGRELLEYQRERARIDQLMRRAPVMTINK